MHIHQVPEPNFYYCSPGEQKEQEWFGVGDATGIDAPPHVVFIAWETLTTQLSH